MRQQGHTLPSRTRVALPARASSAWRAEVEREVGYVCGTTHLLGKVRSRLIVSPCDCLRLALSSSPGAVVLPLSLWDICTQMRAAADRQQSTQRSAKLARLTSRNKAFGRAIATSARRRALGLLWAWRLAAQQYSMSGPARAHGPGALAFVPTTPATGAIAPRLPVRANALPLIRICKHLVARLQLTYLHRWHRSATYMGIGVQGAAQQQQQQQSQAEVQPERLIGAPARREEKLIQRLKNELEVGLRCHTARIPLLPLMAFDPAAQ